MARQIALFYRRSTTRRALRELDAHLLDDVGIDRQEARREAAKRFWRA
ncbi:MAG: DUF1127 domain-containing protein [Geminicoccaceae bacterium]|nr:DUF1127 domain-containing protein [Geminicoccaceae bacterium]